MSGCQGVWGARANVGIEIEALYYLKRYRTMRQRYDPIA